jgi:hypothetical protein
VREKKLRPKGRPGFFVVEDVLERASWVSDAESETALCEGASSAIWIKPGSVQRRLRGPLPRESLFVFRSSVLYIIDI